MFKLKNELPLTQSYIMSKKEKKDFIKLLKPSYDHEIVEHIFNNFDKISISKVSIENTKKRIMSYENNPIFFEYSNDTFYPTVYLLNMFPDIMSRKTIIYEETDSYLANGADLMLKGVLNREEIKNKGMFKLGDAFYVQTTTGIITSIGVSMVSSATLNINIPSGKFLKMVQRLDDALWYMGNKKIPLPNENFKKSKKNEEIAKVIINVHNTDNIREESAEEKLNECFVQDNLNSIVNMIDILKIDPEILQKEDVRVKIPNENQEINLKNNNEDEFGNEEGEEDEFDEEEEEEDDDDEHFNDDEKDITSQEKETKKIPNEEILKEEPVIITPEVMDKNIQSVFLTLLKLHLFQIKDSGVFPLDPGKLLRDYMKPLSVELNLPIDFKLSSFKKINNFLKSLQKEKNLLTFAKPKGLQNDFIISVLWEHPIIKDFTPPVKKINSLDKKENSEDHLDKENVLLQKDEKIEILQKFRPNQKIKNFFFIIDNKFDEKSYYPIKYCNEILINYLKEKNLLMKDAMVKVNKELEDALFRVKQNVYQPDEKIVKMEEILQKWKDSMTEKSFITKTNSANETEVVTNNQFKVKIFAKKIRNKNVTIVEGLQNFVNVKEVIKTFSKHFACSVTLKDFQDFKDAIFIQGYWIYELQTILQDEIKLNKKFIQVEDKLKLKKK